MTPDELARRRAADDDLAVIDVRSRREFDAGHIPGAVHVPFWRSLGASLPQASAVVLYCGHGPRARLARTLLGLRGVSGLCLLEGHMARWRKEGRPLDRG